MSDPERLQPRSNGARRVLGSTATARHRHHPSVSSSSLSFSPSSPPSLGIANGSTGDGSTADFPNLIEGDTTLTTTSAQSQEEANAIVCPICNIQMLNLNQLNQHIDDDHLVVSEDDNDSKQLSNTSSNNSSSDANTNSISNNNSGNIFDEDVIRSWIKNKIKIPNVRIFDNNNNISLNNINTSLSNINDFILTPSASSSSLSDSATAVNAKQDARSRNDLKLARKYRAQVVKSIDKSKWTRLSLLRLNYCSVPNCHNTLKYKHSNNSYSGSGSGGLDGGQQHRSTEPPYSIQNYENNCFSCGNIFCFEHLPTSMKINIAGNYDPLNGIWLRCCIDCYRKKPGYLNNDKSTGLVSNITTEFRRKRIQKIESNKLEHLKIFKRLETYLNHLIDLYFDYYFSNKNNFLKLFAFNDAKKRLLTALTSYWQNESNIQSCEICSEEFNKLLLRKHHCRLCGLVVCDNNCSKEIPIIFLIPLILNQKNEPVYDKVKTHLQPETLRICLNCKGLLFKKPTFEKDIATKPEIIQDIEILLTTRNRVEFLAPQFDKLLKKFESNLSDFGFGNKIEEKDDEQIIAEIEKFRKTLTRLIASFEKISKKIILRTATSNNELQIINSIKTFSLNYLQAKTQPLKKFQALLKQKQKLSKKTVRIVNENKQIGEDINMVNSVRNDNTSHFNGNGGNINNPTTNTFTFKDRTKQTHATPSNNTISVVNLETAAQAIPVKQIKELREELMILKEQQFLISQTIATAKKERKFDEVVTLNENSRELDGRISEINEQLGTEYGFS